MGRGVIEVCGNIHVCTGTCQSAVVCIATGLTEKPNAREIQCEALWVNVSGKHCVNCVCVHSGIARNVFIHSKKEKDISTLGRVISIASTRA